MGHGAGVQAQQKTRRAWDSGGSTGQGSRALPARDCSTVLSLSCPKHKPGRRDVAGVYAIRNTRTGLSYVGSSVNVTARWRGHISAFGKGRQPKAIQSDWESYGPTVFVFDLLEEVDPNESALQVAEQRWVTQIGPERLYNRARKVTRPRKRKGDNQNEPGLEFPTLVQALEAKRRSAERTADFAAQLGIDRTHWFRISTGERKLTLALAMLAVQQWPDLEPVLRADIDARLHGTPAVQAQQKAG